MLDIIPFSIHPDSEPPTLYEYAEKSQKQPKLLVTDRTEWTIKGLCARYIPVLSLCTHDIGDVYLCRRHGVERGMR